MENAPGPRLTMATAIVVARTVDTRVSKKFGEGGGNHESAVHTQLNAAVLPANGVI
jgi:hypothetical protein